MKRKFLFLLCVSFTVTLGVGLFWLAKENAVEAENNPETAHPLAAINEKAKAARDGNLSDAKDFVGEIIQVTGFENELRGFTSDSIKDRVARAESRYRQGQTVGISETKIVRTVNGVVKKFNLPKYAKTTDYEVRKLRLDLLSSFPQIITQKNRSARSAAGTPIDSEMSPAEALFVSAMMLQQKLANPEYQLTHDERASRWAEMHDHRAGRSNFLRPAENRTREIKNALQRAVESASISDALELSNLTLNTLGIEQ